jgi:predicted aspartyl protease/Flp pilus assembly protein TadD
MRAREWRQTVEHVGRRLLAALMLIASATGLAISASDERTPEVYLQLGDLLFGESRYRDAADAYRRARRATDDEIDYRASTGLVRALLRTANFTGARTEADALVQAHPRAADALALHGDALWAMGLFPEAESRYHDATALAPGHGRAHHGLARVLSARRALPEALDHALAALVALPRDAEAHHTHGFVLERLGRFQEAAAALENFQNLLTPIEREDRGVFVRAQIRFLRAFAGRTPFETDTTSAEEVFSVPFRLVRDKIVVEGRVNGGRRTDFVLDTGAEMTVIGRRTAERAGVQALGFTLSAGVGESGLRGLQLGRINELEIGSFRMRNVPTLIKNPPLGGLPTREGESWSPPALGLSMIIDYSRRTVIFGRKLELTGEIEMPLYTYRLAMVRGTVNGREPASFVVDTGGEVISISTALADLLGPSRTRKIPLKVYGISGWDRDAFLMPGLNLAFDRVRFDNFATVVLNLKAPSALLGVELGGIVGHRFLSKYRVGLDLGAGRLRLTALPGAPPSPRAARSAGLERLPPSGDPHPSRE